MKILYNDASIFTEGLVEQFGWEIRIPRKHQSVESYSDVINYLVQYLQTTSRSINDQETIAYNSWMLKFIRDGLWFVLWEVDKDGNDFVEGVDYAIQVSKDQIEECGKRSVSPTFPTFGQKVVISKGVYEGLPIDAVRYPSPDHMSGWWLTTDLYDDNIKSLQTVHFYHIAFKRKDILRYLALPFGFRFFLDADVDVRFDSKVLE